MNGPHIPKHKKDFADEFIICGDETKAALNVGFPKDRAENVGKLLIDDKDVKLYLEYCRTNGWGKAEVTKASLTAEFDEAIAIARVQRNSAAMVGAIRAKAQLHNFLKDEVNHDHTIKGELSVNLPDIKERINLLAEVTLKNALQ